VKLVLIKRIIYLGIVLSACAVSAARAESKLIPGSNITGRERAYAIYQFHAELLPMLSHRHRLTISDTIKKANDGQVEYFLPMFFYHQFSTTYVASNPLLQLDVCSAAHWVDKATKGQAAAGAYWMSYIYLHGYGVKKDNVLAYRWFLFWAATLLIDMVDLPLPPSHFALDEAQARQLRSEVLKWDALAQPDLAPAPCPGCDAAGDHMCKLAELRRLGVEPTAPEVQPRKH
jgi:hypothetical protein